MSCSSNLISQMLELKLTFRKYIFPIIKILHFKIFISDKNVLISYKNHNFLLSCIICFVCIYVCAHQVNTRWHVTHGDPFRWGRFLHSGASLLEVLQSLRTTATSEYQGHSRWGQNSAEAIWIWQMFTHNLSVCFFCFAWRGLDLKIFIFFICFYE